MLRKQCYGMWTSLASVHFLCSLPPSSREEGSFCFVSCHLLEFSNLDPHSLNTKKRAYIAFIVARKVQISTTWKIKKMRISMAGPLSLYSLLSLIAWSAFLGIYSSFSLHSIVWRAVLVFVEVYRGQIEMQHGGTLMESQGLWLWVDT